MIMIGKILTLIIIAALTCLAWAAVAHLRKGGGGECGSGCAGCALKDKCTSDRKKLEEDK